MHIDQQLLENCLKGKEKAQYTLYRKCYGVLLSICRRYSRDHDEENVLLNTGFLKVLNGLQKYRTEVPFEAWIRRIMINTVIDEHRKNKKYKETFEHTGEVDESRSNLQIEYNTAELEFNAEQLLEFIQRLPPMSREVFNMYAIDGYSHREISVALGISGGTSKWHLNNARTKLQEMILADSTSMKVPAGKTRNP